MNRVNDAIIATTAKVARLRGGEGLPLSALAADDEKQRAEHFRFGPDDQQLVEAVLEDLDAKDTPRDT